MYRFWDFVIEPILKEKAAKRVIEIGVQNGFNTDKILKYCEDNSGYLHCIDPIEPRKLGEWQQKYGDYLTYHSDLSLSALPLIKDFDAVLIDGDHNWYTVYNELEIIERKIRENNLSPVVFLHDIGWPYGRRDLYYNPENIPPVFLQAYKMSGILPDERNLHEGGFNSHLYNSIYENNNRNGVLTAVEDFLEKTDLEIDFYSIPAFHGLGILNFGMEKLKFFEEDDWYVDLLSRMERTRIDHLMKQDHNTKNLSKANEAVEELKNDNKELRTALDEQQREFEKSFKNTIDKLEELKGIENDSVREISELKKLIGNKDKEMQDLELEKQELVQTLVIKDRKLLEVTEAHGKLRQEIITYKNEISRLETASKVHLNSIKYQLGDALVSACKSPKQALLLPLKVIRLAREKKFRRIGNDNSEKYDNKNQVFHQENRAIFKNVDAKHDKVELDIVICVHNALDDVKDCIFSVLRNTSMNFRVIVVNDGSDNATKSYLDSISAKYNNIIVTHNKTSLGYTVAANMGLRLTNSDYVILLNSDTVVSLGWERNMVECFESNRETGIVGPLSNAASWQSVPELFDKDGDWMVNVLPKGLTNDQMFNLINDCSIRVFPEVPFVNGFCFMIRRAVIDKIGYLDEETFPKGYGEENDYCIRVREAGYTLRIADNCFVYHRKSKSFTHDTRRVLAKNAQGLLRDKHGNEKIDSLLSEIKNNIELPQLRKRVSTALNAYDFKRNFNLLFILPAKGGGGGAHSVVQEARGLKDLGLNVKVITKLEYKKSFLSNYPEIEDVCLFYKDEVELAHIASKFSIIVATVYHSVRLLESIRKRYPSIIPAYYIQDYEAWFFDETDPRRKEAEFSYELIPDIIAFAKTDWIRNIVQEKHGLFVHKVSPSLDTELYYFDNNIKGEHESTDELVIITAMIRPSSPRRSPKETLQVLYEIKTKYNEKVEIHLFGCSEKELQTLLYNQEFNSMSYYHHGILKRNEVSNLLKNSDVFLDMSSYQAFGRTGLEAMAVGCAVVLPEHGGISEFAENEKNSLLIDTLNLSDAVEALSLLVENRKIRERIVAEGLKTAAFYSIEKAAISELELFRNIFNNDNNKKTDRATVGAIFTKTNKNQPTGSSFHRIVLPLEDMSCSKDMVWLPLNPFNVSKYKIDRLIIQRDSIGSLDLAKSLMEYCEINDVVTIFEIDDHLIDSNVQISNESKDVIVFLMKEVQLITVSSLRLAEKYKIYNQNIEVVPNALVPDIFSVAPKIKTGEKRVIKIGYLGTPTHYEDLKVIEQVVKNITQNYEDVQFEIIGQDFPGFRRLDIPFDSYPKFIRTVIDRIDWDFAIAPLANFEFNYFKSYLKYIDYTGLKIPAIYSKGFDYDHVIQDEFNGLLVENTYESWYTAISKFINDFRLREFCLKNALEDVEKNHLINIVNTIRMNIFQKND